MEIAANGDWTTVERRGVRGGAPDAPGCAAVADLRHERGRSLHALMESYRCSPEACHAEAGAAVPADVTQAVLSAPGAEAVRSLGDSSKGRLLFGAGLGDTWHALPPLFFVRAGAAPKRLVLALEGQLQLARRADRVLVAEEFSGANPHVVDLGSGRVVFSAPGRSAVWLPH
jgi:hypothetical protein